MDRFIDIALRTALLLASIGSVLSLTQMLVEIFTPVRYYWWAAIAMIGSTVVLAAAIRLKERSSPSRTVAIGNQAP